MEREEPINETRHFDEDDDREQDYEGRRDKFRQEREENREQDHSPDRRGGYWDEYGRLVTREPRDSNGGGPPRDRRSYGGMPMMRDDSYPPNMNNRDFDRGYPSGGPYPPRGRDYPSRGGERRRWEGGRDYRDRSPSPGAEGGDLPPFKRRRRSEERDDMPRESWPPARQYGNPRMDYRPPRGGGGRNFPGGPRGPRMSWGPEDNYDMNDYRGPRRGPPMDKYGESGGPVVNFRQFSESQDNPGYHSLPPAEQHKRYEEYVKESNQRLASRFFDEHKNDRWFQEKYEPSKVEKRRLERISVAKEKVLEFERELREKPTNEHWSLNATDDHLISSENSVASSDFERGNEEGEFNDDSEKNAGTSGSESLAGGNASAEQKTDQQQQENSSESSAAEESDKKIIQLKPSQRQHEKLDQPLEGSSSTQSTNFTPTPIDPQQADQNMKIVFIKSVPPSLGRDDIMDAFSKTPGFQKLTLSEARPQKNFHRIGWVTYESQEAASNALSQLSGAKIGEIELALSLNKTAFSYRPAKIAPPVAAEDERISIDFEQSAKLCKQLDSEKEIDNNPLFQESFQDMVKQVQMNTVDQLDRFIHYMRKVHTFCYYCGEEFDDEDELYRKCGLKHVRGTKISTQQSGGGGQPQASSSSTTVEGTSTTTPNVPPTTTTTTSTPAQPDVRNDTWASSLDVKLKSRIENPENYDIVTGKRKTENNTEAYYKNNISKIDDEKYRCAICQKLFRGESFVTKHISLKHPEKLDEVKQQALELQFYENYLNDPKHIIHAPVLPPPPFMRGGPSPRGGGPRGGGSMYWNQPPGGSPMSSNYPPRGYGGSPYGGSPGGGYRGSGMPRGGGPLRTSRGGGGRGMGNPRGSGGFAPREPPPGVVPDPRSIRSYTDLDQPADDAMSIEGRSVVSYEDV